MTRPQHSDAFHKTPLSDHTGDTTDAHDASAISILDSANDFTATDVEGALAELQSDAEAHLAAADPHTGYQKESEKSAANGYASLGAGTLVPTAELGSGSASGTTFLRGDQTWATPAGGGMTTLRTTSNQTINAGAGVFVDVTGLTFAVTSGTRYAFEFYVTFQSAQLTTGW